MAKQKKASVSESLSSFTVAVLIALSIRWLLLEAYVIPSGSMLPSLLIHDHIFVNKIIYGVRVPFSKLWLLEFAKPQKGEVIIFQWPKNESIIFIKRVIAGPGDVVFYDDGKLYVNEQLVEQTTDVNMWDYDWLREADFGNSSMSDHMYVSETLAGVKYSTLVRKDVVPMGFGPMTIPDKKYFVMGDNRNNSEDSRYWGLVPEENILGKAMFVWLSCEETLPAVSFLCNPLTIRWRRLFHYVN
ncbi:MAG: signal peptidase I [Bdellovibrionales bacterium]|nr:signal peptidase I [Bdellovibrionales bacterium]